jgi:hypothetical protein
VLETGVLLQCLFLQLHTDPLHVNDEKVATLFPGNKKTKTVMREFSGGGMAAGVGYGSVRSEFSVRCRNILMMQ